MVVNYDLPLMNERMKGADERPDIETYIHRIGEWAKSKICLHDDSHDK
jgi:superfamily II DNA/RNA helicase